MRVNKKGILYIFLFFLLLFALFQNGITKIIGFSIFPDEFGYWASAAGVLGWDWSGAASLGSYYSYGYSLILFPLLYLFEDSVTAYQAAIAVNMLLMGTGFFVLLKIKQKIYGNGHEWKDILLGIIAVFYPSWIFYMQMTMTEALLMFMFVLVIFLYILVLERRNIVFSICLAFTLAYLYVIHMRTVGVVIAGCIAMLLLAVTRKEYRKCFICFSIILLVMALISAVIKDITIHDIYSFADSNLVEVNDYAGKWWIFKEILTLTGMRDLLLSLLGKVFYLGVASFGLFYWAMYWLGKKTYCLLYKIFQKKQTEIPEWIGFFLLLSVIGELLICAMAMYRPVYVDGLIYGRYSEFLMPVLLIIGLKQMEKSKGLFWKTGIIAGVTGCVVPILSEVIHSRGMERIRGYHIVGMSYLLNDEYEPADKFLIKAWLLAVFIMLIIALVVQISRSVKNMEWILCCIAFLEFGLGMQAGNHYVYPANTSSHIDIDIADAIDMTIEEDDLIVFVNDGRTPYIDFLQMQLREHSIHVVKKDSPDVLQQIENADYLILYNDMDDVCNYDSYFTERIITNQYTLYFCAEEEKSGT